MSLFSQRRKQKLTYKDIKKHYEDIIEGFHSGFPECCILQYVLDISNGLSPSTERQNSFQNLIFPDWVPCDKHCQHFINIGMARSYKRLPKKNKYFFLEYNEKTGKLDKKKEFQNENS